MIQRSFPLPALLAMSLAACQQPADNSTIAIDNGNNVGASTNATPDDTMTPIATSPVASDAPVVTVPAIPAQYKGRWGLDPTDCTSTRGDAKGLITITDTDIRFYEARATLKEQRPAIATAFSGLFAFTGEGQQWERVETLARDGDKLSRSSTTPSGEEGEALTYTRCKA